MPQTTSPRSPSTSQSEDATETKTSLPAQLSNLQKNTKYVSPYAPVAKNQPSSSASSQPPESPSSTRKPESKMSGKGASSAGKLSKLCL